MHSILGPASSWIFGFPVYVSPDRPKIRLSEDIPLTKEFRDEYNQWLVDFFGLTNMLKDGEIISGVHGIFMNPRTYANFKAKFSTSY
jgi:hypothetical protein